MNLRPHGDCRCIFTPAKAESLSRPLQVLSWVCRLVAAVILLQTLFFKFSGAEESVYIFTKVGLEPWGRYGSGIAELIASVLLLTPRYAWAGALLGLIVITGAILSHLTVLGIVVKNDGGLLFGLAVAVFVTSTVTVFLHRRQIPVVSGFRRPYVPEPKLAERTVAR